MTIFSPLMFYFTSRALSAPNPDILIAPRSSWSRPCLSVQTLLFVIWRETVYQVVSHWLLLTCILVVSSSGVQVGPLRRTSLPETSLALGFYLARPLAVTAGYVITSRILAYAFLKLGAVGLFLMPFGIRIQSFITRIEKKFLLISSLPVFAAMLSGSAVIRVALLECWAFSNQVVGLTHHSHFS